MKRLFVTGGDLYLCGLENGKMICDAVKVFYAESPETALQKASRGDAILSLCGTYPKPSGNFGPSFLNDVQKRGVSLFIEYPESLAGTVLSSPKTPQKERLVVRGGFFGDDLKENRILGINGGYYLDFPAEAVGETLLNLVKVAGYDHTVYPIDPEKTPLHPFLFFHKDHPSVLVSAGSLSSFVRGRYAPQKAWLHVMNTLLSHLLNEEVVLHPNYPVKTTFERDTVLPEDAEYTAFCKNADWMKKHCLVFTGEDLSVTEGFDSATDAFGNQPSRCSFRPDCIGETTMQTALDYKLRQSPAAKDDTLALLKANTAKKSDFFGDNPVLHADENSPLYGLMNWTITLKTFYGDDNARALLGMILARDILGKDALCKLPSLDEDVIRCALANLRTTGKRGFRRAALRGSDFVDRGWQYYFEEDFVYAIPHYNAYLWALYLEMYALTGIRLFFDRTKPAISHLMEIGYQKWHWQNSLSGELTRMLLPLSFLVRVEDTPENRGWLRSMVDEVIRLMDESGAVRDMYGEISLGHYPPTATNESYGLYEAPLIQENGDPATDLLYTTNWAAIGLHEAYLVLGDERIKDAADRVVAFLCRIQAKSETHPFLDGAWLRAFDFEKWDYWASSADEGWGAFCIESGWTNTWISATLALRKLGRSLFCDGLKNDFTETAEKIYAEMFPKNA